MGVKLPDTGFVFWPVGNGDSTTVCVGPSTFVQVDLNHLECAEDDVDPRVPLLDELLPLLPRVNERPYLSVFILTHPDLDHCRGFRELLRRATVGELWFSPRVFREFKTELSDDAKKFRDEAGRRVKAAIAGKQAAGDRVRIIGFDPLLTEDEFRGFPRERLTTPGSVVTALDGADRSGSARVFVHAPFKDDSDGDRNDTSVGLQVTLLQGKGEGRALLFGDLAYPTVKRIFNVSKKSDLAWNIFLAPHHCSKSVLHWADQAEEEETFRGDLQKAIRDAALNPRFIVLSSDVCPDSNDPGDNPPHAKARQRYEEIAPGGVLCTGEHVDHKAPEPIAFAVESAGLRYLGPGGATSEAKAGALAAAVARARGANQPPAQRVGFGAN